MSECSLMGGGVRIQHVEIFRLLHVGLTFLACRLLETALPLPPVSL